MFSHILKYLNVVLYIHNILQIYKSVLNLPNIKVSISPKFTNWSNPPNKKRACATFVANIYYFCSLLRYTNIINIENIIIR